MSLRDLVLVSIATLLFGVNMVAIKLAVGYAPPIFVTALRFAVVAGVLVWFFPPWKLPKTLWVGVIVFSVVQGLLHHGALYIGLVGIDAAVGSILLQLGTPFAVIFAWVLLGEKFGWRRGLGMGVAFLGVAVLIGQPEVWSASYHVAIMVLSALCWGFVNVYMKRLGKVNILQLTAWYAFFAVPQLLITSAIFETGQIDAMMAAPLDFWLLVCYMGLGSSVVAYGIWYYLLGQYSIAQMIPFALLNPVIGTVSGVLLLGEIMTFEKIMGSVIVLLGVAFIQFRGNAKRSITSTTSNVSVPTTD